MLRDFLALSRDTAELCAIALFIGLILFIADAMSVGAFGA